MKTIVANSTGDPEPEPLPDFEAVRVLCVGDLLLDRFVAGSVDRISPESPVPVFLLGAAETVPGGAGNVARNIAAVGGRCTLIGVIGDDGCGQELYDLLAAVPQITPVLIRDRSRPTAEKTRFVAQGQHLLRADRERSGVIAEEIERQIVATVAAELHGHDVVLLSDYAKGVLSDRVLSEVIGLSRDRGLPVVVDPKSANLARYRGATVMTPNVKEMAVATGMDVVDDDSAERAGSVALAQSGVDAMLVTRAAQGMTLIADTGPPVHLAASAREVFDVVGAGDTVAATLAVCLGADLPLVEAARLANIAAGIVVGKHGTATVSRSELADELARLARRGLAWASAKVFSREAAIKQAAIWRGDGLRVGFTNGCFDILHIGHAQLLEFARSRCDKLIVAVNSDSSVRQLKGPTRPLNAEADRAELLGALGVVDGVVLFVEESPELLIEAIEPDVLVKGGDYTIDTIVGAGSVLARGGQVLVFDLVPGRSTSSIVQLARASA